MERLEGDPGAGAAGTGGREAAAVRLRLAEVATERIVTAGTGRAPDARLCESMARYGLLAPLEVRARGEGEYELLGGSRRLIAARRLGWTRVTAIIEPAAGAALPAELKALLMNLHRESLQQIHLARQAKSALARLGCTKAELARQLGLGRSTLCQMLQVLACPDLEAAILDEGLEFGAAKRLAVLFERERQALLAELRDAFARAGKFPPVRSVEARVREYQGHDPLPRVPLAQLVEVGLALEARGIAVEIETVPSKEPRMRVALRLDDETAAALRDLLADREGCSHVGTTEGVERSGSSSVGTLSVGAAGEEDALGERVAPGAALHAYSGAG